MKKMLVISLGFLLLTTLFVSCSLKESELNSNENDTSLITTEPTVQDDEFYTLSPIHLWVHDDELYNILNLLTEDDEFVQEYLSAPRLGSYRTKDLPNKEAIETMKNYIEAKSFITLKKGYKFEYGAIEVTTKYESVETVFTIDGVLYRFEVTNLDISPDFFQFNKYAQDDNKYFSFDGFEGKLYNAYQESSPLTEGKYAGVFSNDSYRFLVVVWGYSSVEDIDLSMFEWSNDLSDLKDLFVYAEP